MNLEKVLTDVVTNTDLEVHGSKKGSNFYYLSQAPRHQLITFKHHERDRMFNLPLPWVHYLFEHYEQFDRSYLWATYFGNASMDISKYVSYPFLPNFYGTKACSDATERYHHPLDVLGALWSERFTRDGELSQRREWNRIKFLAGNPHGGRRFQILSHWETLSLDTILGMVHTNLRLE